MLLASHAPINELLSGHVSKPTVAQVGGTIELAVDPSRVRIGMHVVVRSGQQTVEAVVVDMTSSAVRARVLSASSAKVTLPAKASAHFSDPSRGAGALLPYVGSRR
jgi:sRNA-binding protein